MRDQPHDEAMAEYLRADPVYAKELLVEVIHNGTTAEMAILFRQMVRAFRHDECKMFVEAAQKLSSK